jgi:hypothetical protein
LQRGELALVDPDRRPEVEEPDGALVDQADRTLTTVSKPLSFRSATRRRGRRDAPRCGS